MTLPLPEVSHENAVPVHAPERNHLVKQTALMAPGIPIKVACCVPVGHGRKMEQVQLVNACGIVHTSRHQTPDCFLVLLPSFLAFLCDTVPGTYSFCKGPHPR